MTAATALDLAGAELLSRLETEKSRGESLSSTLDATFSTRLLPSKTGFCSDDHSASEAFSALSDEKLVPASPLS